MQVGLFGFSLNAFGYKYKLLASTEEEGKKWFNTLKYRTRVVDKHLSRDYKLGESLAKGSVATVYAGVHKITDEDYIIKSMPKSKLRKSARRMV